MKNKIALIVLLLVSFVAVNAQTSTKYWVFLKDKNGSPYSVSNPSAFLTQRAIQRRAKQNIAITENDIPVNQTYVNQIAATGVTILNRSRWFNAVSIYTTDTNLVNTVKQLSFVNGTAILNRKASPNFVHDKVEKFDFENAPPSMLNEVSRTESLAYGSGFNQIAMLNGDSLHAENFQGQGMVIAILDAGFNGADTIHVFDSLRAENKILGSRDFVSGESFIYAHNNHGTEVFSTMGSNSPGKLIGTAPKASYWLLRTEEDNGGGPENPIEEFNWLAGAEFADSVGADVINSSLGYTTFDNAALNHTYADMNGHTTICARAASRAASKGLIVVNAAGNEGSSSWMHIGTPADADSILAIGAVDAVGDYAGFSSRGPSFDGRIKPNVAAQGQGAALAYPWGLVAGGNGTSFASPITAGLVACVWQANPTKTNLQVIDGIQRSASQYNNPDVFLGYGIPNFYQASKIISAIDEKLNPPIGLLSVFPNPFTSELKFTYFSNEPQTVSIQLIDITGRKIYESQENFVAAKQITFSINTLQNVSKGFYLLKVKDAKNTFVQKVMKY